MYVNTRRLIEAKNISLTETAKVDCVYDMLCVKAVLAVVHRLQTSPQSSSCVYTLSASCPLVDPGASRLLLAKAVPGSAAPESIMLVAHVTFARGQGTSLTALLLC